MRVAMLPTIATVDVMVVEENVTNRMDEMARLNRLVRSLDFAVDLLVVNRLLTPLQIELCLQ